MKIFNNFDTKWKDKEYADAMEKHWNQNVILVQRTFAFWFINWIIPIIVFVIFAISLIIFHFKYIHILKYNFHTFSLIILWIIFITFLRYLINKYLDYKCDYTIITREWISSYKQLGFFNNKNKDLPASKIRSISSERDWLLWNIFWYWSIEIITDWSVSARDDEWSHLWWKMKMTYVSLPNVTRKKIIEVCLMKK